MAKTMSTEVTDNYLHAYLENSEKVNYSDLKERDGLCSAYYDELKKTTIEGFPFASEYVGSDGKIYDNISFEKLDTKTKNNCRLRYHYLPYCHELYIGSTGSGKTTGCVEPQLRAISSQKNKPNLCITDPKGEIFQRNARHLHSQGYHIFMLNFKDITHSDKWNPLCEMYDKKMSITTLGNDAVLKSGKPSRNLVLNGKVEDFDGKHYLVFEDRAFPNGEALDYYIAFRKDYIDAEVEALVNQFAHTIINVKSKPSKDVSWDYGALQLLKGLLLCMLEDAADPKSGFTKDMMNLRTLQMYYNRLRTDVTTGLNIFNRHPLLKNKSPRALMPLRVALCNAVSTMLSYCGVFDGNLKDWFQGHVFAMTVGNTVDLNNVDNKPYAMFIITRDYEKSDFTVAGMFIDWVYRNAIEQADKSVKGIDGKPQTRPLHFLLDEFGNIPRIADFENKIATSRSRNVWFHLFVQSYEQLDLVYSENTAAIITDNCTSQVFLGSQSKKTKQRFSEECGKHYVPTLSSTLHAGDMTMEQVPVVPISELDFISSGDMYNKRIYFPVIKSQFIRSYVVAEQKTYKHFFNDKYVYRDLTPINVQPFTDKIYTYEPLFEAKKLDIDFE